MTSDYKSFNNLYKGLKKSCRNVRWKTSVTSYELNGLKNTAIIQKELKSGTYKLSEYRVFKIHEPKERTIHATRIRDRQVQRSMCDSQLYSELTRHFIYDNCACQIGKGTQFAVKRLKTHLHRYYRKNRTSNGYFLKCDIHHFFDSIDHDIAKACISKLVNDSYLVSQTFAVIDSFGISGIGLGSQISQLVALALLNDLDHMIKEKLHIKHYIRYMDDFILIHSDRKYLEYCLDKIQEHIHSLKLELNSKTSIQPLRHGITFLNWKYYLSDTGKVILRQKNSTIYKKRRHIKRIMNLYNDDKIRKELVKNTIQSIISHLKYGNCYRIIQSISAIQT